MMRDPRYWRDRDPDLIAKVTDGLSAPLSGPSRSRAAPLRVTRSFAPLCGRPARPARRRRQIMARSSGAKGSAQRARPRQRRCQDADHALGHGAQPERRPRPRPARNAAGDLRPNAASSASSRSAVDGSLQAGRLERDGDRQRPLSARKASGTSCRSSKATSGATSRSSRPRRRPATIVAQICRAAVSDDGV